MRRTILLGLDRAALTGWHLRRVHAMTLVPDTGAMATRLLLLADTHLPKRARALPAEVWNEVESADLVVHAGDWVDAHLLDELQARARRLVGVWGNNDHGTLRERLPEVARVEVEGLRLGVVHETGPAKGREERCSARYPDLDVLVFGHSHIPWDTTSATGLRLLNPGSPTDRRRQPHCTYMTATVDAGSLRDVTLHAIPR
jgi:putative phosphoesterase